MKNFELNNTNTENLDNLELYLLTLDHSKLVKLSEKLNLQNQIQKEYRNYMNLIILNLLYKVDMEYVYDDLMNLIKNPETREKFANKAKEECEKNPDVLSDITEEFIKSKEKEFEVINDLSDFKMYKICTIANIDINTKYESIMRTEIYNFLND